MLALKAARPASLCGSLFLSSNQRNNERICCMGHHVNHLLTRILGILLPSFNFYSHGFKHFQQPSRPQIVQYLCLKID